eukprot:222905-Pelagomonas_calceolata.AAC.2
MPITTHALQAAVSFALQTMPITIYALQAAVSFALQSMPVTIHAFQAALSFAFKAMPIANHAPQCLFSVALLAHYQCDRLYQGGTPAERGAEWLHGGRARVCRTPHEPTQGK